MRAIYLDFRGAHSTTVTLSGRLARVANWIRRKIGNKATLAISRLLPISAPKSEGLLFWPLADTYVGGQWAICWHEKDWYSFIVARANTDAQLRCFREGGLTYRVKA